MPRRPKRDCEDSPFEKGEFSPDLKKQAEECIRQYFSDKDWFCGGSIPESEISSDFAIKTVCRTGLDYRWQDIVHACLEKLPPDPEWNDPTVPYSIKILLGLFDEINHMAFPKYYQPGLILLWIKFCKGIQIPSPTLF